MLNTARILACLVAILALGACDDSDVLGPNPPLTELVVQTTSANRFLPGSAELAVGGAVTWNFNATGHNVTFSAVSGAPANIPTTFSSSVARVFTTAGTYNYQCTIHSSQGMTGTIVVR